MNVQTCNPDDPKRRILNVAMEQFAKNGFERTTVRDICVAANVNLAAVNYYFHSKEQLYHEIFHSIFEDFGQPLMAIPARVHNEESWRKALDEWILHMLTLVTSDTPPLLWASNLIRHERHHPSSVLPIIMENFIYPGIDGFKCLIRMGLPPGTDELTVHIWATTTMGQVSAFSDRIPPWNTFLFPPGITHSEWLSKTARHIAEGVTARLTYRPESNKGKA